MKKTTIFLLILLAFAAASARAETKSGPLGAIPSMVKKAMPGDTLLIENGTYTNVQILFSGKGAEGKPIVIAAQTPGKVFIEGESRLSLTGEWLEVSGLWFRNGFSPTGTIIEYRSGSKHAYHCRVTDCVIDRFNPPSRLTKGNWVQLYGRFNRIDHCSLCGKLNTGVTVAAVLDGVDEQNHSIDNNYFGPRPPHGSNGGETIRTGNSFTSRTKALITIEDNYFDRCSGEVEILSIKSGYNTIRRNTFFECEGGLVLRHGDYNVVEGNLMIGNNKPNTGGIRIINKNHKIFNNYLCGLAGHRAFGGFSVMNGVPNSPDYRYHNVENTDIYNNSLIDCAEIQFCLGKDFERVVIPNNVTFRDNFIWNPNAEAPYIAYDDISGIKFSGNEAEIDPKAKLPEGFSSVKSAVVKGGQCAITYPKPSKDQTAYAGAIDPAKAAQGFSAPLKSECGAKWFKYSEPKPREAIGTLIKVAAGQNALLDALAKSAPGDVIELTTAGEYWNDKALKVWHYVQIRAAKGLASKPVLKYNGRGGEPMLVIENGGHLDIAGIKFNGVPDKDLNDPRGFISSGDPMIEDYTLNVDDCEFTRFNRSGTFAIACTPGSFSQSIKVTNCRFVDLPTDVILLTRELEMNGRYNVDNLLIKNCTFANVGNCAIDIQRLGYDESTTGPSVIIDHCTFYNVNNCEQASVIELTGAQKASVTNCTFEKSGQGGASIRLSEKRWDLITISRCNFWEAGRISTFWGTGVKDNMLNVQPVYANPGEGNYKQKANSPLKGKATDGMDIGVN